MRIGPRSLLPAAAAALALAALVPANASADPVTGQPHPADVAVAGWQYLPGTVHIKAGTTFKFGNYDPIQGIPSHSIDEYIPGCTAPPYGKGAGSKCPPTRFSSGLTDWFQVHTVHGTDKLKPGEYPFVCQVHPFMRGTLVVK
ncbi:MAG: cupredoxin domain-containing protein [Sporichthyaceae bacterium]